MSTLSANLAWSILAMFAVLGIIAGKDGATQEHAPLSVRDPEERTPARITAMVDPQSNLPPGEFNLPGGIAFLGRRLGDDPKPMVMLQTRVGRGVNLDVGYLAEYPRMERYTLFPVLGRLYCFDKTVDDQVSAFRLDDKEMPPGVKLGRDPLIFPSITQSPPNWVMRSGEVGGGPSGAVLEIVVGRIEKQGQGKDARLAAKILAGQYATAGDFSYTPDQPEEKWHWRVVHVGDVIDACRKGDGCDHYRVVNIVPPDTKGHMVRGHLCKMIGWIELDLRPVKEDKSAPPRKKGT